MRRSLLWARPGSAWWSVMACSFRDPSSRILWQRCLCTCCTELSSPCNNAASWLCSFLSSPIKLIIKRFREFACAISTPFSVHRTIFRLPFDEIHLLSLQGFKAEIPSLSTILIQVRSREISSWWSLAAEATRRSRSIHRSMTSAEHLVSPHLLF